MLRVSHFRTAILCALPPYFDKAADITADPHDGQAQVTIKG
jgi:tRNA1(Val) A37 N6-methylase TrmN6